MAIYLTWGEAHDRAQWDANHYGRPMGLEKAKEYGRTVYRVSMIPKRPDQRFGWELRCEVVEPEQKGEGHGR